MPESSVRASCPKTSVLCRFCKEAVFVNLVNHNVAELTHCIRSNHHKLAGLGIEYQLLSSISTLRGFVECGSHVGRIQRWSDFRFRSKRHNNRLYANGSWLFSFGLGVSFRFHKFIPVGEPGRLGALPAYFPGQFTAAVAVVGNELAFFEVAAPVHAAEIGPYGVQITRLLHAEANPLCNQAPD